MSGDDVGLSKSKEMEMVSSQSHHRQKNSAADQNQQVIGASRSGKGGLRTIPFIIANEAFEKVAGFGLQANMVLYLTNKYHMSSATGSYVLFLWAAISNFMPILGAFLSDSYLGRFRVIALGTVISLLGMTVLWSTAILPGATPPSCNIRKMEACASPKPPQLALLFTAFALMSIGAGGIRPCSLAFGADQFNDPSNPKNERILQTFFNWYYASVGVSVMISITVIVYIQDKAGWVVGFGIPVGLMLFSTIMYFAGSSLYVKFKAHKSLFSSFAQVIVAAWNKKHLALPPTNSDGWYYHRDSSKFPIPTPKLSFLNKACIIKSPEKELDSEGWAVEPWRLCSVKQVEELKALVKVLPIWSTGVMIAVTISQHYFPVLQAITMDRHLFAGFKIPAASFGIFALITLTLWVAIYDRIIVPIMSRFTTRAGGLTLKERMGIGLALSCVATAVAAEVERKRRATALREGLAEQPYGVVQMSALWLAPQYCLIGLAEAFNAIGQIEFYYSQFPKSMASIGVALLTLGMAVGNVGGSLIVGILNHTTNKGGRESWVSSNLNKGHYDYYYWLLTFLSVINVFYYLLCSWAYGSASDNKKVWDEVDATADEPLQHSSKGSPIIF